MGISVCIQRLALPLGAAMKRAEACRDGAGIKVSLFLVDTALIEN
jgi:hypothetical protein